MDCLLLRLRGQILALGRGVPLQFPIDRAGVPAERGGNFRLSGPLQSKLRYAVPFDRCKMFGHRWDSVPKGLFKKSRW